MLKMKVNFGRLIDKKDFVLKKGRIFLVINEKIL
jgi:hypothetical protein